MQIINPESVRHIEGRLAQLHALKSEVDEALKPLETLKRNVRTILASAEAAEKEAESQRSGLRMLIVESLAKPSPRLHQASVAQRTSLELASHCRDLANEGEQQIGNLIAAASSPAKQLNRLREQTLNEYAEIVIKEAFDLIGDRLRQAFRIKHALIDSAQFSGERQMYLGDVGAAVLGHMKVQLEAVLEGAHEADSITPDPVIEAVKNARIDGFVPMTPAEIARQRSGT